MDALCARARIRRPEFEAAYEGLEDCFAETFAAELERFHERLDPIRKGDAPWLDRVRGTGYALYELFQEDERAMRFLVFEVRSGGERSQLLFEAEIQEMVDLIDEGRQRMEDPGALTRATAEQITGGFFVQLYAVVLRGPLPPPSEIVPGLMYSAALPYLGEAAAERELTRPAPAGHRA